MLPDFPCFEVNDPTPLTLTMKILVLSLQNITEISVVSANVLSNQIAYSNVTSYYAMHFIYVPLPKHSSDGKYTSAT